MPDTENAAQTAEAPGANQIAVQAASQEPASAIDPSLTTTGSPVEGGCVYTSFKTAPSLPTDAVTKISTLTDLVSLGDLDEDGFTASKSVTNSEFKGWHGDIVRTKRTDEKHQFKLTLIESARSAAAKLRYGSKNVESLEDGSFSHIKAAAGTDERFPLVIDELEDTGCLRRTVIYCASIDSYDDVEHKPGDLVKYGFTFTVIKLAGKPYFDVYRAKPAA